MKIYWILTCPFSTNTYFVWDDITKKAAIVDPGADSAFITEKINEFQIIPEQIWLTHGHFDHMFAAGILSEKFGIPVYMNEKDRELFSIYYDQAVAFGFDEREYREISDLKFIKHGDIIQLGEEKVKVLETPGHSKGSVCYVTDSGCLAGDLIFNQSVGRTDLYGGDMPTLLESIKKHILSLDDSTVLYPGHGSKTTVKSEKKANPYIQMIR